MINRRSAGTRQLDPFDFRSSSWGCGKSRGSGKGPPSSSERSTPYRKETSRVPSTKQKKIRNPSTHPSGKSAPFPPRERKHTLPFEENRERLDTRKENRNGRNPSSKVEKETRSNPSTKQTGRPFLLGKENIKKMMRITDEMGLSISICYWVRQQLKISEEMIPIINRNGFQCLGYQSKLFEPQNA